ncbi:PREDICTED: general odorant-binding protein 99a-like [Nicrophorus vespilloides]|uniref:General odorant-binding protein 99a-like n=1 Tax=Nicrophorus vespilloides TaxID=110193 RepID=A0ABM1N896_NICVS|nr:PREDICTED: general odorant-binding protein 99a-like [Nicrophorus vespilloides]
MKFIIVVLVSFIAAIQAHHLSEEQLEKLKGYKMECVTSTEVDVDLVKKAKMGEFTEDDKLKEFLFCVAKKVGLLNEDGDYQVEGIKEKIVAKYGQEAADDVVDVCTQKKESSGPETSFALAKCLHEKSKKHIELS